MGGWVVLGGFDLGGVVVVVGKHSTAKPDTASGSASVSHKAQTHPIWTGKNYVKKTKQVPPCVLGYPERHVFIKSFYFSIVFMDKNSFLKKISFPSTECSFA